MTRRFFLSAVSTATAVDPERLLWIPGAKVISVPKPRPPQLINEKTMWALQYAGSINVEREISSDLLIYDHKTSQYFRYPNTTSRELEAISRGSQEKVIQKVVYLYRDRLTGQIREEEPQ